ncbi:MAG: hypothetical protein WCO23_00670 [bacterium]
MILKQSVVYTFIFILRFLSFILDFFHLVIIGCNYPNDPIMGVLDDDYAKKQKDLEDPPKELNTVVFFGYKVRIWTLVSYSIINLLFYFLFFFLSFKPLIIVNIFNNSFLTLNYAIASIVLYHEYIPRLIRLGMKSLKNKELNMAKYVPNYTY